jgi:ferredoxin
MLCRVKIEPVRVYERREDLLVTARRDVGYRVTCSCGLRSKVYGTVGAARWDLQVRHES